MKIHRLKIEDGEQIELTSKGQILILKVEKGKFHKVELLQFA